MADLLPSSPDASAGDDGDPRVIGVDSEEAADLLAALQSETARDILAALYDDPATPSALAETADTSIQNVRYHLEKLEDADLVEVADTIYSEKGREMKVYAPAAAPLVVFAGSDDDTPGVESALSRLLGALGILGLSSLLVQRAFGGALVGGFGFSSGDSMAAPTTDENATGGAAGDDGAATDYDVDYEGETVTESADSTTAAEATEQTRTATEEPARTVAETARLEDAATTATDAVAQSTTTVADGAGSAAAGLPPGLLFFLGGAVVLAALGVAWYVRAR